MDESIQLEVVGGVELGGLDAESKIKLWCSVTFLSNKNCPITNNEHFKETPWSSRQVCFLAELHSSISWHFPRFTFRPVAPVQHLPQVGTGLLIGRCVDEQVI